MMKPIHSTTILTCLLLSLSISLPGQCDFSWNISQPCSGQELELEVSNPDANADYQWDTNSDGTVDLTGNPVQLTYPIAYADSTYTVTLLEDGLPCGSQEITVLAAPDPAIGVPPGIVSLLGNEIKACNGSSSITLELFNASATYADNDGYTINWGDGSPPETYDNTTFSNTDLISHTYTSLGYFTLFITATHNNGCMLTETYTFYNGGNPSVGISIPGNTVGLCAPATLEFPITNTDNNPPGTEYTVFVNGEPVETFTQDSVPPSFTYTFLESSCNNTTTTGNYEHAYDVKIVASNPCNSSTATIEPIEVSEPPAPEFSFDQDTGNCPGSVITLTNTTPAISEVVSGNPSSCVDLLNPSWSILQGVPGEDWEVVSGSLFGSNELEILFSTPGVYTIEMTVVSFACGTFTFSEEIIIAEPPEANGSITVPTANGPDSTACVPFVLPFNNQSEGENLTYTWNILPGMGWSFQDSTDASSPSPIVAFTQGGVYTIQLTATNACASVTWDTTLILPDLPEVSLDPLPDFCYEATLNLDDYVTHQAMGDSLHTYLWTLTGGQPDSSAQAFPGMVTYDTPGTYEVEIMIANNCGSTTTSDTFQVQEPAILTLPPPATFCLNDAPQTFQAQPAGGQWSGVGVQADGTFTPAAAGVGLHTLTYSYGIGACETIGEMEVVVHALPQVEAGPSLQACLGDDPLLLNGQPAGGQWEFDDNILSNPLSINPQTIDPQSYSVYYLLADSMGCTGLDSTNITVYALPEVAAADTTYCDLPGEVSLPAASPPGGIWNGPGVSDPTGTFDPALSGPGSPFTLSYSVVDANGCSDTAFIHVDLVPIPSLEAGNDLTFCLSDPGIYLSGQTPLGGQWSGPGVVNPTTGFWEPGQAGPGDHVISYSLANSGCEVEDTRTLTVLPPPIVEVGPDLSVCQEEDLLDLPSTTPTGGTWSGTGLTGASSFDPNLPPDTYPLTYTFTDSQGCQGSDMLTVTVHPLPTISFSGPDLICTNTTFSLTNESSPGLTFAWDFGGLGNSQAVDPTFAIPDTGTYTIQLTGTDAQGCTAAATQEIHVEGPPEADFGMSVEDGCGPLSLELTNESQAYAPSFLWDFGNGMTSTQQQPGQGIVYPPGQNDTTYLVQLWVENLCGSDYLRDTLTVYPLPIADFGIALDTGCAPLMVEFVNTSQGSPTEFFWDLGNGITSTDSLPGIQPFMGDTIPVVYPVQLIAANSCGADTLVHPLTVEPEEVSAFINLSNALGCQPFTIDLESYTTPGTTVTWDFGDGNTGMGNLPVHTYTEAGNFQVTLHAANSCAADSATTWVEVLPAPEVQFQLPSVGCSNHPVQFDNQSPGLGAYWWQISNGDTLTTTAPAYLFAEPGNYTVTLTGLQAGTGCTDSHTQSLDILPPPEVGITVNDPDGCVPHLAEFEAAGTGGSYFNWNWGDGNTAVGNQAVHAFSEAGSYTVQLIGTDLNGCADTAQYAPVQVYPLPQAAFTPEREHLCGLPQTISYSNESTGAEGYHWTLAPAVTTNLVEPQHTYTVAGTVEVELIAETTFGCRDTARQQVSLYPQPTAAFHLPDTEGCTPLEVQFNNQSFDANQYHWHFGNTLSSTDANPQITFEQPGEYPVSLIASYDEVCFDTLAVGAIVTAYPTPTASFKWIEDPAGEPTGTVQFINESTAGQFYFWDLGDGTLTEEEHPIHRYTEDGDRQVRLEVEGAFGCLDDTVAIIKPPLFGRLWVPNALTPDQGPGETTLFKPKGVGLKEYHVQVFSTYGQLIWESTQLMDGQPSEGWDGTFQGTPLPQDTYVWRIWAVFEDGREWSGMPEGGKYKRTGAVVLIR